MLEKGRRGRYFPQAFFPFASPLEITDLQDRQYLRHESYALSTLHSHLPIPVETRGRDAATGMLEGSVDSAGGNSGQEHATSTGIVTGSDMPKPAVENRESYASATGSMAPTSPTGLSTLSKSLSGASRLETNKRPMFDLGIYERPNMLSISGVERGTYGMRTFLEHPVSDGLVDEKHEHEAEDERPKQVDVQHMTTSEALRFLAQGTGEAGGNKKIAIGKHAPSIDRAALLRDPEGQHAWRRVGVRPISLEHLTNRLHRISQLRDEVIEKGWRVTVLNVETEEQLGKHLFGELLYPPILEGPHDETNIGKGSHGHDLKVQIEALIKVLSTPGAWLDFSLPTERLLFMQSLYARDTGRDAGQRNSEQETNVATSPTGIEASVLALSGTRQESRNTTPKNLPAGEMDRLWGLVQLLLAIELVVRLDAALRLGVALHNGVIEVSSVEIHHFNRLRNLKVDWDFVVARRWLDLCYAKPIPKSAVELSASMAATPPPNEPPVSASSKTDSSEHKRKHGILGRVKESLHRKPSTEKDIVKTEEWRFECAILPRKPEVMADGLSHFAESIGWDADALTRLQDTLAAKLCDKTPPDREALLARGVDVRAKIHVPPAIYAAAFPNHAAAKVELRAATLDTLGGPLSLAWFGGLILPGPLACDLLICALLENDSRESVKELGVFAYLRSGFVLDGRSWWSKQNVVASVLAGAEGAKESMGWVGLPSSLSPVDFTDGQSIKDGWRVVGSKEVQSSRTGARIFDGDYLAKQSSPLGVGTGHVLASEFIMLTDAAMDKLERLEVRSLQTMLRERDDEGKAVARKHESSPATEKWFEAAVRADIRREGADEGSWKSQMLPLRYNVRFVGCHPCRPPHGHAKHPQPGAPALRHRHLEHLPAHPLHQSFKFSVHAIEDIIDLGPEDELSLPNPLDREGSPVWVIDARGGWQRETLVRAWCANVGRHAIVSRVGRSCLGCAVREARALEIAVVIRVG
jgi:hypothetical protein